MIGRCGAGKTRCINHFLINDGWYLVDLPGYGYARTSRRKQLEWNAFTKDYFLGRESLLTVLLLVDSSIAPQQIDVECAAWLSQADVPFAVVFTKADKRRKTGAGTAEENVHAFLGLLATSFAELPPTFLTSAAEGAGGGAVLRHLSEVAQASGDE